jgi:hypothetical protein
MYWRVSRRISAYIPGSPDIYFEAGDRVTLAHVTGKDFPLLMAHTPRGEISHHVMS